MAFRKDKTGIAQSAVKAASEMTAALVTAGIITDASTARMFFEETRSSIYAELEPVVDADNETFAAAEAAEGGSRKSSGGSRSGGARRSGGGGNSRSISFEDASNLELNSGSFKGCTIAEVYELSASECEDYDYGDGDKTGAQYVRWLASDKNQNSFTRARAAVFLEGVE